MDIHIEVARPSKGVVLIVDDSEEIRTIIQAMLEMDSYTVVTAATGSEGLAQALTECPHLILLDVGLPDITGYHVCSTLKETTATADIPIVFISGDADPMEQVKGLRLGALDYITKPINREIMLTKANSFVRLCKERREILSLQSQQQITNEELQQFSQALDNATDGVLMTDTKGRITYSNISFGYMSRRSMDELEAQQVDAMFHDSTVIEKALEGALDGSSVNIETSLNREDETRLPVLLRCTAIMNEVYQPTGLLFMITDLADQKRAESEKERLEVELFHSQKLESVGQLAAGIAHEINTPIQFVGDNIRFMRDAMQDLFELHEKQDLLLAAAKEKGVAAEIITAVEDAADMADMDFLTEEIPKAIDQSLEGVGRVASIVRAMKEFAHPGSSEMSPADLNEAIMTTITVARNKWKYEAEMETQFDEALPHIPCLIGELNQVVLNLIVNAADAIHDHRNEEDELGKITISTLLNDPWAEIRVQDTGGGIPPSIQDKIFDPFFTTKEVGRGSGQGLAIAHGVILNKHQGEFFFETTPGEGTTFIIRLPLAPETTQGDT